MFDLTMMGEYIEFYSDKHNIKESRVRKIFNKAYAVFGNDGNIFKSKTKEMYIELRASVTLTKISFLRIL